MRMNRAWRNREAQSGLRLPSASQKLMREKMDVIRRLGKGTASHVPLPFSPTPGPKEYRT